jgi:hypothetical protein
MAICMIDISTVSTVVAAVSVVIGVAFTVLEVRHMARTRRTDVIMRIYERFDSKEMIEALNRVGAAKFETFDEYGKKYGFVDLTQIAVFFEGVGVLLEQGLVDIKLLDSLFAPSFSSIWESIRPVVHAWRESIKQPTLFSHFEYLYERLRKYRNESVKA